MLFHSFRNLQALVLESVLAQDDRHRFLRSVDCQQFDKSWYYFNSNVVIFVKVEDMTHITTTPDPLPILAWSPRNHLGPAHFPLLANIKATIFTNSSIITPDSI